jgi:hypothetical protein
MITWCVAWPPSDHDENEYWMPAAVCVGACTRCENPSAVSSVNGVTCRNPSTPTCNPGGLVESVRFTFRGKTDTIFVSVRPSASVTVRRISKLVLPLKSCPACGTVNWPEVTPVMPLRNGWMCVSWRNTIVHSNADGGTAPESGSEAVPLNAIVSPAANVAPLVGAVIDATGGVPTPMAIGSDRTELTPSDRVSRAEYAPLLL